MTIIRTFAVLAAFLTAAIATPFGQQQQQQEEKAFKFRTGVELINVTATVTDANGRFVLDDLPHGPVHFVVTDPGNEDTRPVITPTIQI